MQEVTLIFPHQLFKNHPALKRGTTVIIIEEWLFFRQYNFHKQKLILHRATMQFYKHYLQEKGYTVIYIKTTQPTNDVRKLIAWLGSENCKQINYADVADDWLRRRLQFAARKNNIQLCEFKTPAFLNSPKDVQEFFNKKKTYFQTDFYIHERKKRKILIVGESEPEGGHWSYDADNRKKFPKTEIIPTYRFPGENEYVREARNYIQKNFSNNYGNSSEPFSDGLFTKGNYPTTFDEAEHWLEDFLQNRFSKFGIYEDAMVANENILYHSMLSALMNIGFLEPQHVVDKALEAATNYNLPVNSAEGFIRQIIGWREYIHVVYEREGRVQRTTNYWGFTRKIPETFWKAETGIEPVDTVIKRVLKSGYTHHIERLMVLGNFMILCEFDPDEVYRWFMELFIDAYDWVMVPNTYGMTQFADGGLMMTKPYISGSNYIMKMSDFKKGKWQEIWDGLFWRFMHVHRDFFKQNARLGMLLRTFDKMPKEKRENHLKKAEEYLEWLNS